jgi:AAA domain
VPTVLLTPPQGWADQLRTLPLDELILSYDPAALTVPAGRSLADVENDLAAGAWLARVRSARHEMFRLGATEFELRVRRRPGRDTGAWLAEVLNVDESHSVPRQGRILPRRVAFEKVWEEAPCDLAGIEAELRQREQRLREDARRGAPAQAEVRAHGELQAEVLREYGELETLVGVLEQRPQPPEETALGIVRPDRGPRRGARPAVVVDPGAVGAGVFRGRRVRLVGPDGRSYNTHVTAVRGGLLEIAEPRDWGVKPGEQVTVSVVRPFGMRQNAEALAKFRAGNIEGSWDDLARLLCRPRDLLLGSGASPPAMFYCDDDPDAPSLNDEQRQAVAGAVGSPHAFLIQGPPGTGKTEVICEIVRQLVGRNERVLLLAPTHVAVDEVLGRIGHKPGVRPLRITWSDDRVDEELRRFLPKNVGVELAGRIMRPTDHGQAARWEREQNTVRDRLVIVTELRDVVGRRAAAREAARAAAAAAGEASERLRSRGTEAGEEATTLRRVLADRERELADASTAYRAAAQFEEAERAEVEPGLAALRDAAAELVATVSTAAGARADAREANDTLRAWAARHQAELESAGAARADAERAVIEGRAHLHLAEREAGVAQEALSDAVTRQTGWGRFAERLGLGAVPRGRRALTQAEDAARQCRAELAIREATWHAATTTYHDLLQRAPAMRDKLEQRAANAQRVFEDAARQQVAVFRLALTRLAQARGRDGHVWAAPWARPSMPCSIRAGRRQSERRCATPPSWKTSMPCSIRVRRRPLLRR